LVWRVQIDNREFTVTGAIDSLTARRIDAAEARARGIVVDGGGTAPLSPTRLRTPSSPIRGMSPGGSPGYNEDEDMDYEYYLVETTAERIPLLEAIYAGWVFVEYDTDEEPEVQVVPNSRRCDTLWLVSCSVYEIIQPGWYCRCAA